MRLTGFGLRAPYAAVVVVRLAYLLSIAFFMPESLPKPLRQTRQPSRPPSPRPLLDRQLSPPRKLLQPFKVLLPVKRDGRRDYRLTLVAASYLFFFLIPVRYLSSRLFRRRCSPPANVQGIGNIKVLYARAKFGWGVEEVGRWLSFAAGVKLIVLLGALPLLARLLRKRPRKDTTGREDGAEDKEESVTSTLISSTSPFPLILTSFPPQLSTSQLLATRFSSPSSATSSCRFPSLPLATFSPEPPSPPSPQAPLQHSSPSPSLSAHPRTAARS